MRIVRPQLHLHFGIHVTDARPRLAAAERATAPGRGVERFIVHRRETATRLMRSLTSRETHRETHRQSFVFTERAAMAWPAARRLAGRADMSGAERPLRESRSSHSPIQPVSRANTARAHEEQPWGGKFRVGRRRRPQELIYRTHAARASRAPLADESGRSRVRQHRAADIVWRDVAKAPSVSSASSSRVVPIEASVARPSPRASSVQSVTASEPSQARAAAVRMTDFEPGLLDRLTDDVIRRVERRVRIERERRGL
jgi:hypothetical protein